MILPQPEILSKPTVYTSFRGICIAVPLARCCDWRRWWWQGKVDYRERTSPASWLWANDGLHLTLIARPVQTIACHY
jgi:hypothetical protein